MVYCAIRLLLIDKHVSQYFVICYVHMLMDVMLYIWPTAHDSTLNMFTLLHFPL